MNQTKEGHTPSADWVTSKTNFWVYHNIIALSLFLDHTNQHVEPPGTTVPHESTYLTPWPLEEHKTSTNSSHFSVFWADWVIVIQSLVNWPSPKLFWAPSFPFTPDIWISSISGTSSLMNECYNSFWVDVDVFLSQCQKWYHTKAQSSVNKLWSFSWCKRLQ